MRGEALGEVRGWETVNRMYCMKKRSIFNKRKRGIKIVRTCWEELQWEREEEEGAIGMKNDQKFIKVCI